MTNTNEHQRPKGIVNDATLGFIFCLVSSLFYSLSLFLLRLMTNYRGVSSDWTLLIKESVTVFFVGLFILVSILRGRYRFPSLGSITLIVLAGVCCQTFGARAHLAAYAVIGLVLAGPLMQAFQLLTAAALGAVFLRETLNFLKVVTIVLLIGAVTLLSFSPLLSPESALGDAALFTIPTGPALFGGIALTFIAGFGYALQIALVRGVMMRSQTPADSPSEITPMPISLVMFLITGVGVVSFGSFLLADRGPEGFIDVPTECWVIALSSGLLNMFGFYFQNKGIQRVPVSKVSLIAVSQIFLLTILGISFFGEPANPTVWTGLILTVVGVLLAGINQ